MSINTTHMLTAAAYLRVSTDEQAEQNISIPAQQERIMSYIHAQGWNLFDVYIDDGYSGKNLDRPEISRLIKDALEKKFDAIVVIKLDRLSRRQKDVLYLLEDVFDTNNVGFKSVTEPFDTTTPIGKATIGMLAVFAQLERETIVERVNIAKVEAARQGRFMGGKPPYGYLVRDKKLYTDPEKAETIHFIFNEYINGKGYQYIATLLNTNKVPTPGRSKAWYNTAVQDIINNPMYAGIIMHKGKQYNALHEPIIDKPVWQMAISTKKGRTLQPTRGQSLLTGIIFCGECGARMRFKKTINSKKLKTWNRYYNCYSHENIPHMIRDDSCPMSYVLADEIESKVINQLIRYSEKISDFKTYAQDEINSHLDTGKIKNKIDSTQKEMETIKKKIAKWRTAYLDEAITSSELKEYTCELRERYNILQSEIQFEQDKLDSQQDNISTVDELVSFMTNFKVVWDEATYEEKRELLSVIKAVHVYKDMSIKMDFF